MSTPSIDTLERFPISELFLKAYACISHNIEGYFFSLEENRLSKFYIQANSISFSTLCYITNEKPVFQDQHEPFRFFWLENGILRSKLIPSQYQIEKLRKENQRKTEKTVLMLIWRSEENEEFSKIPREILEYILNFV